MIDLEIAREHLGVHHTRHDEDIADKLRQAESLVRDYLGVDSVAPLSDDVQGAILMVLAELYERRGASCDPLSSAVRAILMR